MDTKTEVARYAQLAVDSAVNLDLIAQGEQPDAGWLEGIGHDADDEELDLLEILDGEVLEVYATARLGTDGSRDISEIVLVLGTGGPHYEVGISHTGRAEGRAYWGGETAVKVTHDLDALAEYLVEFFGGWDS